MRWERIIGHTRQVNSLQVALRSGRSAHAYLFSGPAHVGKRTVADVMAAAMLCEGAAAAPCGECRSCRHASQGHPDLHRVEPDGAAIKIGQVRQLQTQLIYRPAWHRRRVVLIDPADKLTEEAQNALLKSLEEPPEYVAFLLVAHDVASVLPTVRSRCIRLRFGAVAPERIAAALEQRGVAPQEAATLAGIALGRPGVALATDTGPLLTRRDLVVQWSTQLVSEPAAGVWIVAEALEKRRDEVLDLVDLLALWFRDLLWAALGARSGFVNQDLAAEIEAAARGVRPEGAVAALAALFGLKENLQRNANFRLAVDAALIQIQRGLVPA